jgi:hypothetical protein
MSAATLSANCPAPVAALPPRGSLQSVTFSMPRSVTFSMPIDIGVASTRNSRYFDPPRRPSHP